MRLDSRFKEPEALEDDDEEEEDGEAAAIETEESGHRYGKVSLQQYRQHLCLPFVVKMSAAHKKL